MRDIETEIESWERDRDKQRGREREREREKSKKIKKESEGLTNKKRAVGIKGRKKTARDQVSSFILILLIDLRSTYLRTCWKHGSSRIWTELLSISQEKLVSNFHHVFRTSHVCSKVFRREWKGQIQMKWMKSSSPFSNYQVDLGKASQNTWHVCLAHVHTRCPVG